MTAKSRMTEQAKRNCEKALNRMIAVFREQKSGSWYLGKLDWDSITHKCGFEKYDGFENWDDTDPEAYQAMILKSLNNLTAKDMAPIISFFGLVSVANQRTDTEIQSLEKDLKQLNGVGEKLLELQEIVKNHNINTELPEEDLTEWGEEDGRIEAARVGKDLDEWKEGKKLDNFKESLEVEPKRTYGDYQHLLEEHTKLKYKLIQLSVLLDSILPHVSTAQTEMEEMRNDLNILTQANRRVDKQSSAT